MGVDMNTGVIKGSTPVNILMQKRVASGLAKKYVDFYREAAELFSKESMEELNGNGEAAIHIAAMNGHTGALEVMIKKGVDVNLS